MPVFNAGQLKAAVEVARAQRDQYFIAYRSSVLTALEDVENALVLLSQERIRIGKLALVGEILWRGGAPRRHALQGRRDKPSQRARCRALALFGRGLLLQSRVSLATNYIALNKALGGGWDGAVDSAKPEIVDVKTGPRLASTLAYQQ